MRLMPEHLTLIDMTNLTLIGLLITAVNLLWSVMNIHASKRKSQRIKKPVMDYRLSGNNVFPDAADSHINSSKKADYGKILKERQGKLTDYGINEPDVDYDILVDRRKINDMEFMSTVRKILEKNISNPNYSVTQFCSDTNREPSGVFRKFKRIIGMTPSKYIDFKRIELATKEMESNPDLTDEHLAREYGFKSTFAFQNKFSEFRQVSTREFRNELKKQRPE